MATLAPLSIDESPELNNPYSDLSLFLSQSIKEELAYVGNDKKWSPHLQEKLMAKIAPEFKRRFPCYRLGVSALRKIWEKAAYFATIFEQQHEALTQEGTLSLSFLIRENLKNLRIPQHIFHPYLLAQQLALKIAESLATYDAVRPPLRQLTNLVWAMQRHLIPPASQLKPETLDPSDKLILKGMLQALGKNPHLSQKSLQAAVQDDFQSLDSPRRLDEEAAYLQIDNPAQSPTDARETALEFLTTTKHCLSSLPSGEIEHKITLWTMQGELALRTICIEATPLLELLHKPLSLRQILHTFLRRYPHLHPHAPLIAARARFLSRYRWYALQSDPSQSTISRFFEWHLRRLSGSHRIEQLADIYHQKFPMLPFDVKSAELVERDLIEKRE